MLADVGMHGFPGLRRAALLSGKDSVGVCLAEKAVVAAGASGTGRLGAIRVPMQWCGAEILPAFRVAPKSRVPTPTAEFPSPTAVFPPPTYPALNPACPACPAPQVDIAKVHDVDV